MPIPAEPTGEVADRIAIRHLVDAWAHYADRRKASQQAALFTPDGSVAVYRGDPASTKPVQQLQGHVQLAKEFTALETYDVTSHINAQSMIRIVGEEASAETYCLAIQVRTGAGSRELKTMAIRYLDAFVHCDDQWLFSERQIIIDWSEEWPSTSNHPVRAIPDRRSGLAPGLGVSINSLRNQLVSLASATRSFIRVP